MVVFPNATQNGGAPCDCFTGDCQRRVKPRNHHENVALIGWGSCACVLDTRPCGICVETVPLMRRPLHGGRPDRLILSPSTRRPSPKGVPLRMRRPWRAMPVASPKAGNRPMAWLAVGTAAIAEPHKAGHCRPWPGSISRATAPMPSVGSRPRQARSTQDRMPPASLPIEIRAPGWSRRMP
jgi:hypothetical protein